MPNVLGRPQIRGTRAYLCSARNRSNLTQAELARRIGVDRSIFSMWENGTLFLPFERAQQISKHLKWGIRPGKAGNLYARHNTDIVRMYLDSMPEDAKVPKRLGMGMLRKLQTVLIHEPFYSREELAYVKRVYRELLDRTLLDNASTGPV